MGNSRPSAIAALALPFLMLDPSFLVAASPNQKPGTQNSDPPPPAPSPELWLCPPMGRVCELADHPDQWAHAAEKLAGIKLYIGDLTKTEPARLQKLAALANSRHWQIAVECAGTANPDWQDQTGEKSAQIELRSFNKWIAAGGRIDFLDLDGPIRRLLGHAGWGRDPALVFTSYDRCARELADYLAAVRTELPGTRHFLLTNFPNWGWKNSPSYHARGPGRQDWGDYHRVLETVLPILKEAGFTPAALTVDNPWDYLSGRFRSVNPGLTKDIDWTQRLLDLEATARAHGLGFNLIVNSQTGGATGDREFCRNSLEMLHHVKNSGLRPDRIMLQSWYEHPTSLFPDSNPDSLTGLLLQAAGIWPAAVSPARPLQP
jgi:hypothetical protein